MTHAVGFLTAFAHALSALSLYPDGHSSRERALDATYEKLLDLLGEDKHPVYSFLGEEVVYRNSPLKEMRAWEWSERLASIGIQRLEFDATATQEELEAFLEEILVRLGPSGIDTAQVRQTRQTGIKWGEIGIRGDESDGEQIATATLALTLGEEAETIRWLHDEVTNRGELPLFEAEALVRGLSVAMHGDRQMILPLLKLREFDEYTTTHSLNVSVLTMGLAEWLGLGAQDVRAFGVAGLLHDLGKVKVPLDILNKSGKLDEQERAVMSAHPAEGARIIVTSEPDLDMAAVVAYEHHVMLNGGGYPSFAYRRDCHRASKLVHVCDVYDALRTNRPYRDAWPAEKVLAYLEERSGVEFDGQAAHAFAQMMRQWEPQVAFLEEDDPVPNTGVGVSDVDDATLKVGMASS
ncbi:MAG: HD-GYP domain-containing protein [Gemmatimonadales bacterium]